MKAVLVALASLFPMAALADDANLSVEEVVERWRAANWTCESGQDHDGAEVDLQKIKEACAKMGAITVELSHAGYCYDAKAVEWATCPGE